MEEIQERIRERDEADSNRDHSPMRPAEGAILLDTSHLSVEEVVDRLSGQAQKLIEAGSPAYEMTTLRLLIYPLFARV